MSTIVAAIAGVPLGLAVVASLGSRSRRVRGDERDRRRGEGVAERVPRKGCSRGWSRASARTPSPTQ
ncbi:hypothetical protein BRC68_11100 [Halobacteriales archaeon QH_6_64_20]|nr:MAG: hypothetical protein BRC68_11100 [Halobacteriales archaeon QH_6_64_20]